MDTSEKRCAGLCGDQFYVSLGWAALLLIQLLAGAPKAAVWEAQKRLLAMDQPSPGHLRSKPVHGRSLSLSLSSL